MVAMGAMSGLQVSRTVTRQSEDGKAPVAAATQARARYLREAGGGLVAALLGSVTWPGEIRDGTLIFDVVPDGGRQADEVPSSIRIESIVDVEALAPRLVKGCQVYAEGPLNLSTWTARDGTERTGLHVRATHVEILGR